MVHDMPLQGHLLSFSNIGRKERLNKSGSSDHSSSRGLIPRASRTQLSLSLPHASPKHGDEMTRHRPRSEPGGVAAGRSHHCWCSRWRRSRRCTNCDLRQGRAHHQRRHDRRQGRAHSRHCCLRGITLCGDRLPQIPS